LINTNLFIFNYGNNIILRGIWSMEYTLVAKPKALASYQSTPLAAVIFGGVNACIATTTATPPKIQIKRCSPLPRRTVPKRGATSRH
jgi:hypothetical protein